MIKKMLIFSIVASTVLFVSPCYSMWCCGCGDEPEEQKSLTQTTKRRDSKEEERMRQEAQRQKEEEERKRREAQKLLGEAQQMDIIQLVAHQNAMELRRKASQLFSTEESQEEIKQKRQIVTHGSIELEFPRNLILATCDDGAKTLSLKNIFYMMIYKNYDEAVENNADIKALHQVNLNLRNKSSVTRRMNIFYNDMREKVGMEDTQDVEEIINCIQLIVADIPENGPFLIKFGEDQKTKSCAILFRIQDGALFMRGPGNQEQQEEK